MADSPDLQDAMPSDSTPFRSLSTAGKSLNVGGSLSALFTAIPLRRLGHNVCILESATSSSRQGLHSGIGLMAHTKRFFDQYDRLAYIPFGTPNLRYEALNRDLTTQSTRPFPGGVLLTTWDATYFRLKANFDGLPNDLCSTPPAIGPEEGEGIFETGKKVVKVSEMGAGMEVVVEDVSTGTIHTYSCDVVIAADGASSSLRTQLHPDIHRSEPGYLLWRGSCPLSTLPDSLQARVLDKTLYYPMTQSYGVFYTIPAENGSLALEDRLVNCAWYDYPKPAHDTVSDILTDIDGHTHRTTLPLGKMRSEVWARQIARAKQMMGPDLFSIWEKIEQPFVTIVSSVEYPQAKYFNDKLYFVGDALVQLQPCTAFGAAHAANEAMLLAEVFQGNITAQEWEDQVLADGKRERARSREFPRQWLEPDWAGGTQTF